LTWEQLFYQLNVTIKYFSIMPLALIFFVTTDPSEFASSLHQIGVHYKAGYSVALALRYIPDVRRTYHEISQAQQARGIDLSRKAKLHARVKGAMAILLPLIFSSLDRIETISNAMDVGAPSNFERMAAHFTWAEMRDLLAGVSVTDDETRSTISAIFKKGYCLDPHTAVGWKAADRIIEKGIVNKTDALAVISTAHPAKFAEVLEPLIGPVQLPPSLQNVMERKIRSRIIPAKYDALRDLLS